MANIVAFNPSQLPAFAKKGEVSAIGKALMGGSAQTGKRISIKGGVFRLIADGKEVATVEERYLDVVIVNAAPKVSRTFYAGTYDETKPAAPDCWSQNGDKPADDSRTPQASNCAQCPQNISGSGQGESRACRYSQRLAVLLANDQEGDVMQLSLAATSIFGKADGENRPLQEHARWLTAQGVDPTMLITRLKFDTKAPVPKLFFKPMRWLTDDEYANCQERGSSAEALRAVTMTVAAVDGVVAAPMPFAGKPLASKAPAKIATPAAEAEDEEAAPPPAAVKAKVKPKMAPAPLPPEDDEEAAPEPTVRTPTPKAKALVPAATSLASTLAAWDDED